MVFLSVCLWLPVFAKSQNPLLGKSENESTQVQVYFLKVSIFTTHIVDGLRTVRSRNFIICIREAIKLDCRFRLLKTKEKDMKSVN